MKRHLYLVAYDVCCPQRLRAVLKAVKCHRVSGQKSVAECWMTPIERDRLACQLLSLIDCGVDRLHILRLDPRMRPHLFGVASTATCTPFLIG